MPTPLIANTCQVVVKGTLFGQLVENVWHVLCPDPPISDDLEAIAAVFHVGYGAIAAPLSQDISFTEVYVRYMGAAEGPEYTLGISPPMTGGAVLPSAPGSVALCVSLRTALAGRRFRGRKFFSGIPEDNIVGNAIDPAFCTLIVNAVDDLRLAAFAAGYSLEVVSLVGLTATLVASVLCVDNYVDSQRRRLTGRGR